MSTDSQKQELINKILSDTGCVVETDQEKDEVVETISDILHSYNLSTDLSFVEKVSKMKMSKNETMDMSEMPRELTDGAFLPVNSIADLAIKQDIDLLISQIPEWFRAVQIVRDMICESDVVTGKLSRMIEFDRTTLENTDSESIMKKIEEVEDRLDMHSVVKDQFVFNTVIYGEGPRYCVPYSKVFSDLYKYKMNQGVKEKGNSAVSSMFERSNIMNGYGYTESVEVTLNDTIVMTENNNSKDNSNKENTLFTESEIMSIKPDYHTNHKNDKGDSDVVKNKQQKESDKEFDDLLKFYSESITFVKNDIALPVIEESAHDLMCVYETKYKDNEKYIQEANDVFTNVMTEASDDSNFSRIKGIYQRTLPATKLYPIRIDTQVIAYYYVSDTTRPENAGERKNSGLSGYTLRSPAIGNDTFSPDRLLADKLASKIINNFDLKFMRDNTALHAQIVTILQAHKFNESMLRFVLIPAEHVIMTSINKDGMGKGHSMLEPGLVAGRMYMFLKLYSLLFQINNSQIRVINMRMSGMDTNYKQLVNNITMKFSARRITSSDIFNYRSSMTKVSGGSELVLPLGSNDTPPLQIDTIPAADSPLNPEMMELAKHDAINALPVPSSMMMGAMSEIEFAKEVEQGSTLLNSFISSSKIDMNKGITEYYRRVLRYETDIDPNILKTLTFSFRMATAKTLSVTVEMIQNFDALVNLTISTFLRSEERKPESEDAQGGDGVPNNELERLVRKRLMAKYLPIDVDDMEIIVDDARSEFTRNKFKKNDVSNENIIDDMKNNDDEIGGF